MKLPPIQTSQTSIKMGLQMVGKFYLNAREWNGKFAQAQNQHQYPKTQKKISKFSQTLTNNIMKLKLDTQVCGLCQIEKKKMEMERLCKCHHSYCYSCMNSYAIIKIQDLAPVKCPQQECSQTMILTSNVYRYLPDSIKLKYLQNKHTFSINKEKQQNRCPRCLEPRHIGECKYSLSPNLVEQSFKFRQCPDCKVQIMMTSGKKRVTCSRCNKDLCYLCGQYWRNGHQCNDKQKIRQLQREYGYTGCSSCCCDCCNYGCQDTCSECGDCCCQVCGSCCTQRCCCYILFSCQNPGPGCFVWNITSIPIRLILTVLVFTLMVLLLTGVFLSFLLWIVACLFGGFLVVPCEKISKTSCPLSLLLIILYPLVGIYGFFQTISQTYRAPFGFFAQVFVSCCKMMAEVWVQLSPGACDC